MATWISPQQCPSLAALVESVVGPLLVENESPICLEMEIPVDIPVPADPQRTAELLCLLAIRAIGQMPEGGDLTFTGCETAIGYELEIADSGSDVQDREQTLPLVAALLDAKLTWQNCPQGGAAVTICFPRGQEQRRIAA